jgi:hypothetical protein
MEVRKTGRYAAGDGIVEVTPRSPTPDTITTLFAVSIF